MTDRAAVLVTGGAGYIGSHVCKALSARGYLPVAYDNLIYGHDWAVKWGPLEVGDITDGAALSNAIARHRPVAVVHLAAFAYVGESVEDPEKYYRNNLLGMLTLLSAVRAANIRKFVFSSSCVVYGETDNDTISEDHSCDPVNPYGNTKYSGERMMRDFMRAYGGGSVALRYFNAAGADPAGEIGEDHEPEPHLIPRVLDAALGKGGRLNVFGDDYETPDGTCVRDYIHVTDLADGHVKALDMLDGAGGQHVFNLGAGRGVSVLEMINAARRVTGADIPYDVGARRPGDPARLIADTTLARGKLKWQPELSDIDTILETAWLWTQSRQD